MNVKEIIKYIFEQKLCINNDKTLILQKNIKKTIIKNIGMLTLKVTCWSETPVCSSPDLEKRAEVESWLLKCECFPARCSVSCQTD